MFYCMWFICYILHSDLSLVVISKYRSVPLIRPPPHFVHYILPKVGGGGGGGGLIFEDAISRTLQQLSDTEKVVTLFIIEDVSHETS